MCYKKNYLLIVFLFCSTALFADNVKIKLLPKSQTSKSIEIDGDRIKYDIIVDTIKIYSGKHNNTGEPIADISYTAYVKTNVEKGAKRSITFLYNGGPGGASAGINFFGTGPEILNLKLTSMNCVGSKLNFEKNKYTWLRYSDLVYIDLPGTGYSRVVDEKFEKQVYSDDGDAECCTKFIYQYLYNKNIFEKDFYIAGESYGGVRTILVVNKLRNSFRIVPRGIILLSPIMSRDLGNSSVNIISDVLNVPTYAATAYHYKILDSKLQNKSLDEFLSEVEQWSFSCYLHYLMMGAMASSDLKQKISRKYMSYTGLSESLVENSNLRFSRQEYADKIFENKGITLDLLDSRSSLSESENKFPPRIFLSQYTWGASQSLISYLKNVLEIKTSLYYNFISFDINKKWTMGNEDYLSMLKDILLDYPQMKVFIGCGYYDLDIPYYTSIFELNQLNLPVDVRNNITLKLYHSGHMIYLSEALREKIFNDIKFVY